MTFTRNRTVQFTQLRDRYASQRRLEHKHNKHSDTVIEIPLVTIKSSSEAKIPFLDHDDHNNKSSNSDYNQLSSHREVQAPAWMAEVDRIKYQIQLIQTRMRDLTQLYKKQLLPSFEDRSDEEQAIEIITQEITQLFFKSQSQLKKLDEKYKIIEPLQKQLQQNIQSSLASQLQDLSMDFRRTQKNFSQQMQGFSDTGILGLSKDVPRPNFSANFDTGMSQQQLQRLKEVEVNSQEVEKEMKTILSSVNELAEVYKELSILVVDQGTILDRIDYNIEQTDFEVKQVIENLQQTEKSQKNGLLKRIIMLLAVLILVSLLLLVLKAALKLVLF